MLNFNRSVRVHYPHYDVQNSGASWHWQDAPMPADAGKKVYDLPRAADDQNALFDYKMLSTVTQGRFFVIEKASGHMAIAEIELEFAEARESIYY